MTAGTIAVANLLNRPLRSMLLVLSVAVATATGAFTLSIHENFVASAPPSPTPRVIAMSTIGQLMPLAYANRLRRVPGVTDVEYQRLVYFVNPAVPTTTVKLWLASAGFPFTYPHEFLEVGPDERKRWAESREHLLVNPALAAAFGWKVGDRVTMVLEGKEGRRVGGVVAGFTRGSLDAVIAHHEAFEPADQVSRFSLGCASGQGAVVAEAIDKEFQPDANGTVSMTQEDFFDSLASGATTMPRLFDAAALLVALIGTVLLLCTTLVTLEERLGEIGTLRALGFTRGRIVGLLVRESLMAAGLGAALGAALSIAFLHFDFGDLLKRLTSLSHVAPSWSGVALAFGVALLIGFLLACLPSLYLLRAQRSGDLRA